MLHFHLTTEKTVLALLKVQKAQLWQYPTQQALLGAEGRGEEALSRVVGHELALVALGAPIPPFLT